MAMHRAVRSGHDVLFLLTMLDQDGKDSRGHGLPRSVLEAQGKALGVPMVFGEASWENYEAELERVVRSLMAKGVQGGVFGDLGIEEHREWVHRFCSRVRTEPMEPLWNVPYEALIRDFLSSGFKALIVDVQMGAVGDEWLGREFNRDFIQYLRSRGVDLCGEGGEYHTVVTDGPMFRRPIRIKESRKAYEGERGRLEIIDIE